MKFENLEKAKAICLKIGELRMKQQQEEKIHSILLSDDNEECLFETYPEKSLDNLDANDTIGIAAYNLIAAIKMETASKLLELHNELELL